VRYACIAAPLVAAHPSAQRAALPGGTAGAGDRRLAYERELGRPFLIFSDLTEGEIDAR
jgi:hypothetical protein